MDELLINIVTNTKVNNIETRISNPITGKKYPNRTIYVLLKKYVDDFFKTGSEPRMVGLAGLRGTGKTTLMWQIADYLKESKIPIYFFNVNEIQTAGYNLYEILKAFEKFVLKKSFREFNKPLVLLFDEIHDDPDWARTLKILYDEAKTTFILCTGSSALLLQSTEDLARRIKIEKVYPFRFIEFITAKSFLEKNKTIYPQKSLASDLKQIFFYSNSVEELHKNLNTKKDKIKEYYKEINSTFNEEKDLLLVSEYIKYHNVPAFIFYKDKSLIFDSIIDLFSRVIDQDIKKLGNNISVSSKIILKLLLQLAISDEINFDALSKKTGINKTDIEQILDLLEKAELINILNPYGGSETRIWKNKKIFFMSPSLRLALLSIIYGSKSDKFSSKLYEDIVAMYLIKTLNNGIVSIAKQTESTTPDFIIETLDKPLAIEVGSSKATTDQFSKIDYRYGILVSNNIEDTSISSNYLKLPLKWFLLL